MLEIHGASFRCCDGLSRRNFLKVGFLGLGGLTLADALRTKARAAEAGLSSKETAVVFLSLAGGPTHMDTYDLKPDAPVEYRGSFQPIATKVPGVQLCELLPRHAQVMDKLAVVRSLHHNSASHQPSSHLVQTGYYLRDAQNVDNECPSSGSLTARLRGSRRPGLPPYVAIPQATRYGRPAYLGKQFAPFEVGGDPNRPNFQVQNLDLTRGLSLERLESRRGLRAELDRFRAELDLSGTMDSLDSFAQQAYDLITGPKAREAFDLSKEDTRVRDRYGRHTFGQSALLARRLIEAGVTFVTVTMGGWDDHGAIKQGMERKLPPYDQAVAALVEDLYDRGLDKTVMLVAIGEFGRTPRVNASAGRDHWGNAMSALVAGGGLRMGQVIGSTDKKGERPADRPLRPEDVLATMYHVLAIDPNIEFTSDAGRPIKVLHSGTPIAELV